MSDGIGSEDSFHKPLGRWSVFFYGVGHMLNDITSACWFTYLLVFLTAIGLSPRNAAAVMLSGQIADGFTTIFAGELIDRFGHFKIWHAAGSVLVAVSFSSVFGGCLPCKIFGNNSLALQTIGYSTFAAIFNVGWAATQVSHMSMVNCITLNSTSRVVLASCRNAFTMVANLSLYGVAFFVFNFSKASNPTDVENQYRRIAYVSIFIGCCFVAIFHLGTSEPQLKMDFEGKLRKRILWSYWFKKILYYQVAVVYMLTRLVTNVSQAFLAFYVINDLQMTQSSKALVPAIIYVSSFIVSITLQEMTWTSQRLKAYYSVGGILWVSCGTGILVLTRQLNSVMYIVSIFIGVANALMTVTGVSMQSVLVGKDYHGCAFVYGSLSFLDKLSCGLALYILESYQSSSPDLQGCFSLYSCFSITRYGLGLVPGICALLGVVITYTMDLHAPVTFYFLEELMHTLGSHAKIRTSLVSRSVQLPKNHLSISRIMRIRVQYRKFIKPSASTQNRLKTIKLSLIDQQVQPVYVPIILYYKAPESSTSVSNCKDEIREKLINLLEGSLSEALNLFYPLAGRFGKDGLSVECGDHGVEYLVTQVDGLLSQIVEHGKQSDDVHAELLNALVPAGPDVADHSGPLARIQVNTFECGGLVLGIQVAHKLADAFSIIAFVHGWATACRVGTLAEVTNPTYELLSPPSMEPRVELPQLKEPSQPQMGSGLVTRRFVFEQKAIMRLKNLVSSEKNRGASKVGIVMAVIWQSLIDVWKSEHRYTRPSMVIFPVNMRQKSSCSSQVPDNLCRNYLHLAFTVCYKPPVNYCVLDDLLNAINDAKTSSVKAFEKQISGMDLIIGDCGINREGEVDTVVMTSWCNFQIYEADFGWGKPEWISSVRKRTPGVILMDSKCGEGVEAWVGLSGTSMLLFQNQPHILTSTC